MSKGHRFPAIDRLEERNQRDKEVQEKKILVEQRVEQPGYGELAIKRGSIREARLVSTRKGHLVNIFMNP